MFKKILVAMDSSPMGQILFEQGLDLARKHDAELLLLHVLSTEEENSPMPMPPMIDAIYWAPGTEVDVAVWRQEWEAYETECLHQLQRRAVRANQAGVKTEFRQVAGSPGRMICRIAQSWGADIILIGSHGRTGLTELFLGSVSNYVLHHAPCSVFTVKSPTNVPAEPVTAEV